MMKKYFAGIVGIGLVFSLSSCGEVATPEQVLVAGFFEEDAPRKVRESYKAATPAEKEKLETSFLNVVWETCDAASRTSWSELRQLFPKGGNADQELGRTIVELTFRSNICDE